MLESESFLSYLSNKPGKDPQDKLSPFILDLPIQFYFYYSSSNWKKNDKEYLCKMHLALNATSTLHNKNLSFKLQLTFTQLQRILHPRGYAADILLAKVVFWGFLLQKSYLICMDTPM